MNVHPEGGAFCGRKVLGLHPLSARLNRRISIKDSREMKHRHSKCFADEVTCLVECNAVQWCAVAVEDENPFEAVLCDLCAKVCPVNCIDIESIKATEAIGQTSDGTTKRLYAAKFDIDMAKCMYCGLCTIVCPTECITMTNQYDKTVFQLSDLVYQFSDMTPEDAAEKRALFDKQQAEKQAAKLAAMKQKEGGA